MSRNLNWTFRQIDRMTHYLQEAGVAFSDSGFPILRSEWFLRDVPDRLIAFSNRNDRPHVDPARTVLCFYCKDDTNYVRIDKLLEDLPIYKGYMGVVAPDVTVTSDMDLEWQKEIMLLNSLALTVLGVNGVKIVLNLRNGSPETLSCFEGSPRGVMAASGSLGCGSSSMGFDLRFTEKLFCVRPSVLLLYGKRDPEVEESASVVGIPVYRFDDAHTISKRMRKAV